MGEVFSAESAGPHWRVDAYRAIREFKAISISPPGGLARPRKYTGYSSPCGRTARICTVGVSKDYQTVVLLVGEDSSAYYSPGRIHDQGNQKSPVVEKACRNKMELFAIAYVLVHVSTSLQLPSGCPFSFTALPADLLTVSTPRHIQIRHPLIHSICA